MDICSSSPNFHDKYTGLETLLEETSLYLRIAFDGASLPSYVSYEGIYQ